jgi:ubiquinone/menaquinone biosynthesis C-methylase UbiE
MFDKVANNQNPKSLATQLRQKRLDLFYSLLSRLDNPVHILDVGGTEKFWQMAQLPDGREIKITLLNLGKLASSTPNITCVEGDARDMRFPDSQFDVVFSNSVIEHVGSFTDQQKMAKEVKRVGKRYFIQTPNKYFPIEPHFVFPLYQFLPSFIQIWLLQHFNLGWIKKTPNRSEAEKLIKSIRLLSKAEFRMLFPNSNIFEEKFLGLTKSFIAYEGW